MAHIVTLGNYLSFLFSQQHNNKTKIGTVLIYRRRRRTKHEILF